MIDFTYNPIIPADYKSQRERTSSRSLSFVTALSENPCNWVPYDLNIPRTFKSTFLVFANAREFRFLLKATQGSAPRPRRL